MSIVANTYIIGSATRFTFYRHEGLPTTATVVQQHRDGNFIRKDNVTFEASDGHAFFDINVVGDCVVTLNTGETKIFDFDAATNSYDKYYDDSLDNSSDDPFPMDEYDPYNDSYDDNYDNNYGRDFIASFVKPIESYNDAGRIYACVPYIPKGQVCVSFYSDDGILLDTLYENSKYFWSYSTKVINNIIVSQISFSERITVSNMDEEIYDTPLYDNIGKFYYAIGVDRNPITDPELKVFNHDGLYGKTYGETII